MRRAPRVPSGGVVKLVDLVRRYLVCAEPLGELVVDDLAYVAVDDRDQPHGAALGGVASIR
jgi:hypothetical protein